MAVYTEVTEADLSGLLADYDLGTLVSMQGIDGGIENTNYFVTLQQGDETKEYVLTLFEELGQEELPFFVELCQWQADRGVDVPFALKDRNGIGLKRLNNRPAVIQPRLRGSHVAQQDLTPEHCASAGKVLAQFHNAGKDFYLKRQAHRGVFWWRRESANLQSHLEADEAALLMDEVNAFDQLRDQPGDLPMGVIHGDLFHDNALFEGNDITALLDLYNAATAYFLYDLAIVANDWCTNADGSIDLAREKALLEAYDAERPFTDDERKAWPILARTAAMRFWLSRLIPWLGIAQDMRSDDGPEMKLKDPAELKAILLNRRQQPTSLPA